VRDAAGNGDGVSDWLDRVRAALDASLTTVPFFFRDDDAGWDDELLWDLLDRAEAHGIHIDLAVIPSEVGPELATALCDRASTGLVHLHQHGFRHVNHETNGRKYEFGPSRSHDQQLADIAQGRALIGGQLHPYVEPIFTPPWNRCTDQTAAALANLGFEILSRDITAEPFGMAELAEVPVTVDWFAKTKSEPWARDHLARQITKQITIGRKPVGIMLHHAITNEEHLGLIDQLFSIVASHPKATSTSIYNSSF
jgi:peptidoglycan/xylan/chitin deacetylase (PgdA/CDA1 family)